MSKKNKSVKNFKYNVKLVRKELKRNNVSQKKCAGMLDHWIDRVETCVHDKDANYDDLTVLVVDAMCVTQAVIEHFRKLDAKPKKVLVKRVKCVESMGRALSITSSLDGKEHKIVKKAAFHMHP